MEINRRSINICRHQIITTSDQLNSLFNDLCDIINARDVLNNITALVRRITHQKSQTLQLDAQIRTAYQNSICNKADLERQYVSHVQTIANLNNDMQLLTAQSAFAVENHQNILAERNHLSELCRELEEKLVGLQENYANLQKDPGLSLVMISSIFTPLAGLALAVWHETERDNAKNEIENVTFKINQLNEQIRQRNDLSEQIHILEQQRDVIQNSLDSASFMLTNISAEIRNLEKQITEIQMWMTKLDQWSLFLIEIEPRAVRISNFIGVNERISRTAEDDFERYLRTYSSQRYFFRLDESARSVSTQTE